MFRLSAWRSGQGELSLWRVLVLSLKGGRVDYTAVPPKRAVLLLAVPMILEMFMESLFAVVNIFFVSRLGSDAVAVVGLTESVMTVLYAVAIGLSIAASSIVARRIGEKNVERAAHAAGQILIIGLSLPILFGALLGWYAPEVLRSLGASDSAVTQGTEFARIMFGFNTTVFLIFTINAIFRGVGDAVLAMRTLCLANVINAVLAPSLIFGWGVFPELGLSGAAWATNIGRGIGVLYQLRHLLGKGNGLQVQLRHFRPLKSDVGVILRTALPGVGQLLLGTISWVLLFRLVASFGSAALAGYTIAIRVIALVLTPAIGIANAAATLVGQNLGAGRPREAAQAVVVAARVNSVLQGFVAIILVASAPSIVSLFTEKPDVLHQGTHALWMVGLALPLYAAGMCLAAAFNGAGDTWTPTRVTFTCFWLGRLPLAWLLAQVCGLGALGVFIAVPVSFAVLVTWNAVLFKQGKWQHHKL